MVGFSLAKEFNDEILDLKKIKDVTFVHIIDNETRFGTVPIVNSKPKRRNC